MLEIRGLETPGIVHINMHKYKILGIWGLETPGLYINAGDLGTGDSGDRIYNIHTYTMLETWGLEPQGIVYKYKYIHNMLVGDKETGNTGDTYIHTYMHACMHTYIHIYTIYI